MWIIHGNGIQKAVSPSVPPYDLLHKMHDVAKRFVFRGQNPPVMTKEEKRAFNWNVARIRRLSR